MYMDTILAYSDYQQIAFYRQNGRPILKVLLMATFTYQLAYFGWRKMEAREMMAGRRGEC